MLSTLCPYIQNGSKLFLSTTQASVDHCATMVFLVAVSIFTYNESMFVFCSHPIDKKG